MNSASENPTGVLSEGLVEKLNRLVKPGWAEKFGNFDPESAEELWAEILEKFGQFDPEIERIYGNLLFEKYPNFINALTTSEALEIKRMLASGLNAEREASVARISKILRLPSG